MFELSEIEELANQVNLSILYEIAKNSAQIGNEILKVNYNKIQKISSKGRKGDLVTNVDFVIEKKIKNKDNNKVFLIMGMGLDIFFEYY